MKPKSNSKLIKLLLGISIALFLASCHYSKYLQSEIHTQFASIAWNKDSTAFAFIAKSRLYRMPEGIAKFPDGGRAKNEYLDFSLYYFDIKQKKLTCLVCLNKFYSSYAYQWISFSNVALNLQDSLLFYKLKKPLKFEIEYLKENNPNLLEDLSKTYSVNIYTYENSVIDTSKYQNLFNNKREWLHSSIRNKYLTDVPYMDWGIYLKKLYPQPKSDYMDYIIENKHGVIDIIYEQIAPEFTDSDKKYIIDEMTKKQEAAFNDWIQIDPKENARQWAEQKSEYEGTVKYTESVKKRLNIPSTISEATKQDKVLKSLQTYGIEISDEFKFKELFVYDQGYNVEFKLIDTDSISIDKYKKWYKNKIKYLLNKKWEIIRTHLPSYRNDIITLQYVDNKYKYYLELAIDYSKNTNKNKFFTFSVSEEHIKI